MFEIVLKQDYEDIFFYREFEVNGLTNNQSTVAKPVSSVIVNSSTFPTSKQGSFI
jgi:hypothetical protein